MLQGFLSDPERYLQWVQPAAMKRRFELRDGDHSFASLEFQSAWGSLAVGQSNVGSWTLKRVGFFNPRVTIRLSNSEQDLAIYRPRWTGQEGVLQFGDGRSFTWRVTNFWSTRYALLDEHGKEILTFHSGKDEGSFSDFFKYQARMHFGPAASGVNDLMLLAITGWYLIILQREDAAAAAT